MLRAVVGICLALVTSVALSGTQAPEREISLDLSWLAPPAISTAEATVVRMGDSLRLATLDASEPSQMTWKLRYPVDLSKYPVVGIRYRSATMSTSPDWPVFSIMPTDGTRRSVNVARAGDITQDSYIHEYRVDIGRAAMGLAGGFQVSLPPGMLRFDLVGVSFQTRDGESAPAPIRQQVQMVIRDGAGNPVGGSRVDIGPLERSNWVTQAVSGFDGVVIVTSNVPREGSSLRGRAIEAAIEHPGYQSQYIAYLDAGQGETTMAVLASVRGPSQPVVADAYDGSTASGAMHAAYTDQSAGAGYGGGAPIQNYYSSYNDYSSYRPDYGYGYDYGGPYWGGTWYPPGYVIIYGNRRNHGDEDQNCDGEPGHGNGGEDGSLHGPPHEGVPGPPARAMQPMPVTSVARYGVTSVPSYGVTSVATYGVTSVPAGYGLAAAPRDDVSSHSRLRSSAPTRQTSFRLPAQSAPARTMSSLRRVAGPVVSSPSRVASSGRSLGGSAAVRSGVRPAPPAPTVPPRTTR